MTKSSKIPEPPEAVKNGSNGLLEVWTAVWEHRIEVAKDIAGIKGEVRVLIAVVLILVATVMGGNWL